MEAISLVFEEYTAPQGIEFLNDRNQQVNKRIRAIRADRE